MNRLWANVDSSLEQRRGIPISGAAGTLTIPKSHGEGPSQTYSLQARVQGRAFLPLPLRTAFWAQGPLCSPGNSFGGTPRDSDFQTWKWQKHEHAGLLQSRGSRQRLGWLGSVRQWLRLGQLVENAEEILGLTHDTPGQCPVPGQCDLSGSSPPREPRADLPTQPQRLSSHEERLSALSKKRRSVRRARALDLPSFGLCEHVLTSWDEGRTPLRPSLAMQSLQSGSSGSSSRSRGFTWKGTSFRFFTPALWLPFPPFPTLAQVRMRRSLSESVRGER